MSPSVHPEQPLRHRVVGLLSSLALVALVVGMPLWLLSAGRPALHIDVGALWQALQHRRPGDIHQVATWLRQVAVVIGWITWAWLTLCVVLEVVAWRTGRTPARLPGSRSVQWVAAVLVGTSFALAPFGRVPAHTGRSPSAVSVSVPTPVDVALGPADGQAGGSTGGPLSTEPFQSGKEVGRAAGTRSPVGAPPAGTERRPTLVHATSVSASAVEAQATPVPPATPVEPATQPVVIHTVAARESLWSIAEGRLGESRRWREIAELNYGRTQPDGSSLGSDHWLRPGWQLVLPEGSGRTATVPSRHLATTGTAMAAATGREAIAVDRPNAGTAELRDTPTTTTLRTPRAPSAPPIEPWGRRGPPVVPVGAGIVGVGVADLVDRLRKVQQRHRSRGSLIRLPDGELRAFEQRLRVGDGATDLDAVESAVDALAAAGWPVDCRLTGVLVDPTNVRLVFDAALPPSAPGPFRGRADGRSLDVERTALAQVPTRRRHERVRFTSPTLVSVGRCGSATAMVDLEGHGAVVLAGDRMATEGLGRAMALELATSRWAPAFDLVLIGFGAGLDRGEGVTVVGDAGPVIADLTWRKLTAGVRLDDGSDTSSAQARRGDDESAWRPVVVICGPGIPEEDVAAVLELAADGRRGICAVAMAGPEGLHGVSGTVLHADRPSDILGGEVQPQSADGTELELAVQLLDVASRRDDGTGTSAEDPEASEEPDAAPLAVAPYRSRAPGGVMTVPVSASPGVMQGTGPGSGVEVEVGVLGPVAVRGAARGFTRAWSLELVVYLALHPDGAANEVWATALWPDRLMAPSSLHSTASVARRSLGTARDGSDHLPRSHGRLALAPSVGTDWDRFQDLASTDDPQRWEEALSLVRGRPFDGIRATDWALLDGTAPMIESAVVDLAGRLAGERLRAGDTRTAEWAARRGLVVSPYDERLYRMLLRTADAAGNPGGVEAVMTELVKVVADEVEPIESVHPSTLALYRSLSRRPSAVFAPVPNS